MASNYKNVARAKAIEKENAKRLLKVNPKLDNESGIYFLIRKSEQNENEIYVGQSVGILTRLCQHLAGYEQYIDLSVKAHKLYDAEKNPHGYRVEFLHFPREQLDEKEQFYIKLYQDKGWILKNKTSGSQGKGKQKIAEYKRPKTYRQGVQYGKLSLARAVNALLDKYFTITLKADIKANKRTEAATQKLNDLLNEDNYKD